MTSVQAVVSDDVRVIMCLAFDNCAPVQEIARFKSCLLQCQHIVQTVELTGSFDLMVEARVGNLADYHEHMGNLRSSVGHLISRYEANFICRRFVRQDGEEKAIWVPCPDGKVRIAVELIDKVTAEGDYMRVHSRGASHLIHVTMRAIRESLGAAFVLLNRSVLVRCDFIDRLLHLNTKWVARLNDGDQIVVAKSHVNDVMERLEVDSPKVQSLSSKEMEVVE